MAQTKSQAQLPCRRRAIYEVKDKSFPVINKEAQALEPVEMTVAVTLKKEPAKKRTSKAKGKTVRSKANGNKSRNKKQDS